MEHTHYETQEAMLKRAADGTKVAARLRLLILILVRAASVTCGARAASDTKSSSSTHFHHTRPTPHTGGFLVTARSTSRASRAAAAPPPSRSPVCRVFWGGVVYVHIYIHTPRVRNNITRRRLTGPIYPTLQLWPQAPVAALLLGTTRPRPGSRIRSVD